MSKVADIRFKEKNPNYWKNYMKKRRKEQREKRISEAMKTMFGD